MHQLYIDIVNECRVMFNIQSVSSLIVCRRQKLLTKFMDSDNSVYVVRFQAARDVI